MSHVCGRDLIWLSIERNPMSVRPQEIVVERCAECRQPLRVTAVADETAPIEDDGA